MTIDYSTLIADAYLIVVRDALEIIAKDPIPGKYCIEISIDTNNKDLIIPKWLKKEYPKILTIILNNRYEQLTTKNYEFSVVLYFKNKPVELVIPYDSIILFNDTMNNFNINFSYKMSENESTDVSDEPISETPAAEPHTAEIISLDTFRKKKS